MAIYDNDGTTSREIGKLYDHNGLISSQIDKVYDYNGTTSSLIYQSIIDNWMFQNGVWNPVAPDIAIGTVTLSATESYYTGSVSGDTPVLNTSGILFSWYAYYGNVKANGYSLNFSKQMDFTGYTKLNILYQKISNGHYVTGGAADGKNDYFTVSLRPAFSYPNPGTPATVFQKANMNTALNVDSVVSFTIGSNRAGFYPFISVVGGGGSSGKVRIKKIYLS